MSVVWTLTCGFRLFGSALTNKFLKREGLDMLVRSHQCKLDGFDTCQNGKVDLVVLSCSKVVQVLTVFSASNYYTMGSNKV